MNSIGSKFSSYGLSLICILLSSCGHDIEESTRLEKLTPFHVIVLDDVFNVYIVQDSSYEIMITGWDDSPDHITLTIVNDSLTISNTAKNKWLHPETNKISLYIHANRPSSIFANATCYFETVNPIISDQFQLIMGAKTKLMEGKLDLNGRSFLYWNNWLCGGKLTLSGNVNQLYLFTFGTTGVDANNLNSVNAYIENNSKGDCEVLVSNELNYSIRGTGNIYLGGNPTNIILGEKTASGNLIIR